MARNKDNRTSAVKSPSSNGDAGSKKPKVTNLDELQQLQLEKLLGEAEKIQLARKNIDLEKKLAEERLSFRKTELDRQEAENNTARNAFLQALGIDINDNTDFIDGKLVTKPTNG